MDAKSKLEIGQRLRQKREEAGFTREKLGELCNLSPRFIANVEFGENTFSIDSLIAVCRALSCSSDFVLFGRHGDAGAWSDTIERLTWLDAKYRPCVDKMLQGLTDAILEAEQLPVSSK